MGQDRRGAALAGQGRQLVGPAGRSDAARNPYHGIGPQQLARSPRAAPGGGGAASLGAAFSPVAPERRARRSPRPPPSPGPRPVPAPPAPSGPPRHGPTPPGPPPAPPAQPPPRPSRSAPLRAAPASPL